MTTTIEDFRPDEVEPPLIIDGTSTSKFNESMDILLESFDESEKKEFMDAYFNIMRYEFDIEDYFYPSESGDGVNFFNPKENTDQLVLQDKIRKRIDGMTTSDVIHFADSISDEVTDQPSNIGEAFLENTILKAKDSMESQ